MYIKVKAEEGGGGYYDIYVGNFLLYSNLGPDVVNVKQFEIEADKKNEIDIRDIISLKEAGFSSREIVELGEADLI